MKKVLQEDGDFYLRDTLFAVPDLPGGTSVRTRVLMLNAIYSFAPQLRFHPDDDYSPTSVPWYLDRVGMNRHRNLWPDVELLDAGEVTVTSLVTRYSGGQHSGRGTTKTDFFLEIAVAETTTRRGSLDDAECYVHFRRAPAGDDWDVQYWVFYAYNGDITTGLDIEHEADWEHITVRISPDLRSVRRIFYASHASESEWRTPGGFLAVNGHPIAYSAYHSHSAYWSAGTHSRTWHGLYVPDDRTSDLGQWWETWDSLRVIGRRDVPRKGQQWIQYTGRWGQVGSSGGRLLQMGFLSGPYGPAMQGFWTDDDKGMDG